MVRLVWWCVALGVMLQASVSDDPILRNDLINPKAAKFVRTIGREVQAKTGVHLYLIATNEHFPQGFNFFKLTSRYPHLQTPYVILVFAPFATIKNGMHDRGRFGLLPSSKNVKHMYDYDKVRDAAVGVVSQKDGNRLEAKVTVGVVQGYSVLADEVAKAKGVALTTTIPDSVGSFLAVLRWIIYAGSLIVLWFFVMKPYLVKRKQREG